ncbi:mRNA capping enzyme, C-terminal domain containing protein [Tritrichomonas foetus]|uniref:mRNA guanylyltransferase n=1 Tax=Tritrichomonas foetus TaxID=1144522 RepID=A0A1J4K8R5_9EUKA|nr:mRNA capping enzyme, C-terminal domain containing protein [Tritrichomonas foetus]|eukprot:OHT07603.1 mRNA capping enzyme, C-terminal domain containing protein [Tritrichomonas foetus]
MSDNYINEKRIPEGWIMCPNHGDLIEVGNTYFVPMKTPLGHRWNQYLFTKHQFTPQMIATEMKRRGKRLTTIFSFANSDTRYDIKDLSNIDLGGEKITINRIWIKVGQQAPTDEVFQKFRTELDKILLGTNDIIGIHCTHGFNRTGFIIVRYLIENYNMSLIEALTTFRKARPPGIYKADYVQRLFEIYNQENTWDTPVGTKDSWKFPDPGKLPHYVQREEIKLDIEDAPTLGKIVNSFTAATLKRAVMSMCRRPSSEKNFPGSQPVTLAKSNERSLEEDKTYRATYKSDGTRYFMLCEKGKVYLVDRKLEFREVNVKMVNRRGTLLQHTLLDGELVSEECTHRDPSTLDVEIPSNPMNFLVFDIVMFEDLDLIDNDWDTRMDYVEKGCIAFRKMWMQKKPEMFENEDFRVSLKKQWSLNKLGKLQNYVEHCVLHLTDGIIFTPLSMRYVMGQCNQILKWKPIELNSSDFIALENNGVYYLAVRISYPQNQRSNKPSYADIPISILDASDPEILNGFDKKIVECSFDVESQAWFPLRVRTDKTHPNAYSTFVKICISIDDDLTVQKLQERFGIDDSPGYD